MSELKVDVKQLMKDWNDCPEDDGFDEGHPIFMMAEDVDRLNNENYALKHKLEQAQARIGELADWLWFLVKNDSINAIDIDEETIQLLEKTPAQSLADIEARAVEKYKADIKHQSRMVINASNPTNVFEAVPLKAIEGESQQGDNDENR